jgi:translation initiation factor IF-2
MAIRKVLTPPNKDHSSAADRSLSQEPRLVRLTAAKILEITLKSDTVGTQEALLTAIKSIPSDPVIIRVIHAAVGPIGKSDLDLAATGSHLVIGFNVETHHNIPRLAQDHGVEVRIYRVLYRLVDDLKQIAASLIPPRTEESITGKAKVIALFNSSRKGIILGCEVREGVLAQGERFRVITAMGPSYSGKIESLHIGQDVVKEGRKGQQVGIKIADFNRVKVGDWVECYKVGRTEGTRPWHPKPGIMRIAA